jgi:hypothetical protein
MDSERGGPPARRSHGQLAPCLSELLDEDAKQTVLHLADVHTLIQIKSVDRLWCAVARRELRSRLCRREGQPMPALLAPITDLDVELLDGAGRSWEAASAGTILPNLERLHGYGFVVDVAAVRGVDLTDLDLDETEDEDEDDESSLGVPAKAALHACITGEGEPPVELLLAAVACAGSGEAGGIPVEEMRADSFENLHLVEQGIGGRGAMLIARLVPVMASLTQVLAFC